MTSLNPSRTPAGLPRNLIKLLEQRILAVLAWTNAHTYWVLRGEHGTDTDGSLETKRDKPGKCMELSHQLDQARPKAPPAPLKSD